MYDVLLFGDCMKLMKKVPDKSCEMILTDIPYDEVNKARKNFGGGYGKLRNLNKEFADVLTFNLDEFVKSCSRVCYGSIYIFCGFEQISPLIKILREEKIRPRLCIWHKPNASPMNIEMMWWNSIEACVFGRFPKATFNEFRAAPVWNFNFEPKPIHQTQKPVPLFKYLIETSSKPGSIILDPCAGSATSAIACLLTSRKYICIENNLSAFKAGKLRVQVTKERLDAKRHN